MDNRHLQANAQSNSGPQPTILEHPPLKALADSERAFNWPGAPRAIDIT